MKHVIVSILVWGILLCLSGKSASGIEIYSDNIYAGFEYDDNVTRERFPKDYQDGIIWRLRTGFGVKNFIPLKGLDTRMGYTLGMRDVNTTNNEDFNSHNAELSADIKLKTGTTISLKEAFKLWNSQSDLFNFYDNTAETSLDQPLWKNTRVQLSYKYEQKWFQNKEPAVQARNFFYHQWRIDIHHFLSKDLMVKLGYVYQPRTYNRRPINFKNGRQIVTSGLQRDRQNVLILGFLVSLFNNTTDLTLLNQVVSSDSNSQAFDFNGNRTQIILTSRVFEKLRAEFIYQLSAYNLAAYQTPDMGYELSETRTDDQSGIRLGITYDISDQVSLLFNYEHIANTVFFTREFYKENTCGVGMRVKF